MTDALAGFNPFDPRRCSARFPSTRRCGSTRPVLHLEAFGLHLVTRHDLVLEVLRDPQTYSSLFGSVSLPLPADAATAHGRGDGRGLPAGARRCSPPISPSTPATGVSWPRRSTRSRSPRSSPSSGSITVRLIDSWIERGVDRVRPRLRGAAAGRGHRPRAQRARRPHGRLQAVVRRLDRGHRHEHLVRRAPGRRARRERVPALLRRRRSSGAATSRATTC